MSHTDQKPSAHVSTQENNNETNELDNDSNNGMELAMKKDGSGNSIPDNNNSSSSNQQPSTQEHETSQENNNFIFDQQNVALTNIANKALIQDIVGDLFFSELNFGL